MIEIYTDGAARANGSENCKASWGFVVVKDGVDIHQDSGTVKLEYTSIGWIGRKQSNNTGELRAIYEAIKYAVNQDIKNLTIVSDSMYCIDSLTKWDVEKKKKGKHRVNYNEIKSILTLMKGMEVDFEWVKGHDDNYFNDIADKLANNVLGI